MAKQKMKYTEEEMNAMRIRAMIDGVDISTVVNEPLTEDDIEIEIEDDKPKKKSSKKETESKGTKVVSIDEREEFKNLNRKLSIKLRFNSHDIHYKNQLWGIPERMISYNFELIKLPKPAMDAAEFFYGNSEIEKEKANTGATRYFRIVTYETVPYAATVLGYVRVRCEDGKLKFKTKFIEKAFKSGNMNYEKTSKLLKEKARELKRSK